jgi:hypothetical protein
VDYIDKFGTEMTRSEWQELAADARYCHVAKDVSADGRTEVTTVWKGLILKTFRIVVLTDGKHVYSETTYELRHAVSAHARIVARFVPVAGSADSSCSSAE